MVLRGGFPHALRPHMVYCTTTSFLSPTRLHGVNFDDYARGQFYILLVGFYVS
jgi:hypothetical protein